MFCRKVLIFYVKNKISSPLLTFYAIRFDIVFFFSFTEFMEMMTGEWSSPPSCYVTSIRCFRRLWRRYHRTTVNFHNCKLSFNIFEKHCSLCLLILLLIHSNNTRKLRSKRHLWTHCMELLQRKHMENRTLKNNFKCVYITRTNKKNS